LNGMAVMVIILSTEVQHITGNIRYSLFNMPGYLKTYFFLAGRLLCNSLQGQTFSLQRHF
jgi:hypothetical protein